MNGLLARRLYVAMGLLIAVAAAHGEPNAADAPKPRIAVAGTEHIVWLIHSSPAEADSKADPAAERSILNRFARQTPGGAEFKRLRIPPEVGRIQRWAASGQQLHVFFEDGTHHSYSSSGRNVELTLPGRAVPETVTGHARAGLYAIVRGTTGIQVRHAMQERLRKAEEAAQATQPTADTATQLTEAQTAPPPTETTPTVDAEDTTFHLVAYTQAHWDYVTPITPVSSVSEPARWWLCASPEAVFVFWPVAGEGDSTRIVCTSWADGVWSEPELIALDGVLDDATAMYVTPRVAFAAATRPPTEPASTSASWRLWRYVDDMWQPGKPLTLAAPPTQAAVAAFGQNVLVADLPADANVTVGIWPLDGGQATRPPKPIDVFDAPPRPAIDPHVRDWVGTAVLIGIIALVFWRRQDSLSASLPLPAGAMLSRYWKRLAAALIDLAPAMLATGWFWLGDAQTWLTAAIEYAKEVTATGGQVEAYAPPAPAIVIWGWLVTRLAYALYCGLFEWYWGMTPGKRLLGCRVVGEMGEPPALKQIVLRNAARLLELEMMPTMWPLLLIVFLTRNRQRIGDLLARTVVVEPAPPMPGDHHLDECG